jgi:hypothetical protein
VFKGLAQLLGQPVPQVEFRNNKSYSGDLIGISGLHNFPLHSEDNWEVVWKNKPEWTVQEIPDEQESSFTMPSIVVNKTPLSNMKVWVVGDSFIKAQKQFINATFRNIRYIGHWQYKMKALATELISAKDKPDIIIVVRVERSF